MKIKIITHEFSVCKVTDYSLVNLESEYCFIGKTDEENMGFSYEVLDRYIIDGICEDSSVKVKIDTMHAKNQFKLELMPSFSMD